MPPVHGDEAPEISTREVDRFAWDVQRALNEFISFARAEASAMPNRCRRLDQDASAQRIREGLREQDPELWRKAR
jgi:hypothetical protein